MILDYKGIDVFYSDSGKGTALVLLHGFLENSSMWQPLIPEFSKRNRLVCIDLLGHGKTGNLGYIHSMEEQAKVVKAVLDQLRLRKYIIVGHSMGGYISLAFASLFSSHLKGLCLMNSTAYADNQEKKKNRNRAIEAVKKNHKTFIRLSIPLLFSEANRSVFKAEISAITDAALTMSPQGIIAALEGMKTREDSSHILRKIGFKKLLLAGKNDPVLTLASSRVLAKKNKVNLISFEGGHMSHVENKEELISALKEFIKSCN